jgi:hypothetical protein
MLSDAERERIYGGPERVAEAKRRLDELVAAAPPLTNRQRDALKALLHPARRAAAASQSRSVRASREAA